MDALLAAGGQTGRRPRSRARSSGCRPAIAVRARAAALGRAARRTGCWRSRASADPADRCRAASRALATEVSLALESAALTEEVHRAHERGALRLAGPALQRPHHRARRGRLDRLPEPLDRARPRLHARGGRRAPASIRLLQPRRGGPAPARARRPATHAAAGTEVLECAHAPRRRQRRASSRCSTPTCSTTRTSTASCSTAATSASARRSRSSSPTRPSTTPSPASPTARCSWSGCGTRSRAHAARAPAWP